MAQLHHQLFLYPAGLTEDSRNHHKMFVEGYDTDLPAFLIRHWRPRIVEIINEHRLQPTLLVKGQNVFSILDFFTPENLQLACISLEECRRTEQRLLRNYIATITTFTTFLDPRRSLQSELGTALTDAIESRTTSQNFNQGEIACATPGLYPIVGHIRHRDLPILAGHIITTEV